MLGIPVLKPREVIALLAALGFVEAAARLAQANPAADGRATTVPFHAGRDISPIFLRQIAKDIGLPVEDLLRRRVAHSPNNPWPVRTPLRR